MVQSSNLNVRIVERPQSSLKQLLVESQPYDELCTDTFKCPICSNSNAPVSAKRKVDYERERLFNTGLKCGALQIKLPAFRLQVKLYLVRYIHSSVGRQLVRTLGLNCALERSKENILGLLGSKYYQNEERSETNPLVYGRKRENQQYQCTE
jgi:hypothetical protein